MQENLTKYLAAFKKLKIDKAHGIAPHKPILLLSILQAYQNQLISNNRIYITPELVALFKTNWNLLVKSNHDCRFALPFYHLTSDKFWKLIPKHGFENILQIKSSMRSFANLDAAIEYGIIDNDLWLLMKENAANQILRQFLLDEYFPGTKENFNHSKSYNVLLNNIEGQILNEEPGEYKKEIDKLIQQNNEEDLFLRGALFKREIPRIYDNRCCISGMKIDAIISVTMVDACHIVPFSESHNDTVTNGICLCPNLHRAFDRGLITIDENYKVNVSKKFKEEESSYLIRNFEGKEIYLPKEIHYFPLVSNFMWHKQYVYKTI